MVSVTLAICSKGRSDELRALVGTLLKSLQKGCDIVVVEDVSDTSEAPPIIADITYKAICESKGFGYMRQECMRLARGEWVVFIDDDCLPFDSWLPRLLAACCDDVDAVGGGFVPQQGNAVALATSLLGLPGGGFPRLCALLGEYEETTNLSNGSLALRRRAVMAVGGYDESLASGGEDSDLIARLQGRTWFVPHALVAHRNRDNWLDVWKWFVRRGRAVAMMGHPLSWGMLRKSGLFKLLIISMFFGFLPFEWGMVILLSYYTLNTWRVFNANNKPTGCDEAERLRREAMRFSVLLVAPILRLWMDVAFDVGFWTARLMKREY